jgi:integrase/recombinase XerD
MSDWEKRFLDDARRRRLSPRTIEWYEWEIKSFHDHGVDLSSCGKKELLSLIDYYTHKSVSYARTSMIFLKSCLVFLGREELAKLIVLPRDKDRERRVKEKLLSADEVKKLIAEAPSLQDRLLIELLYESGARRGEIYNLRIKDVQFDEYSAILNLTGKSGTRRIRVYSCIPDLRSHLNNHPDKDDANARLFRFGRKESSEFSDYSLYMHVARLGERILGKPIHPHQFRHTRATSDSSLFTDRELMLRFGWTQPNMISIYSHLSMRDLDEKDLVLHGLKKKEEILKPITQVQKCQRCGEENAPIAVYCVKCGETLEKGKYAAEFQKTKGEMQKRDVMIRDLAEKFEQATKRLENLERKLKER